MDSDARDQVTERFEWLDGLRGATALFVVFHHMWLGVWGSFPRHTGPWWLGPFLYGHLAVAVFIVVSGFSLALAPLRDGDRLKGGARRFIRRRAWRIIPAYWAALVLSTAVTALLLQPEYRPTDWAQAFVVHGLLLQDVVGSVSPNGAFWSIAVEWQIYFVFPLILVIARFRGHEAAAALTVVAVLVAHMLARLGSPLDKIDHLTPQFLALFALGVLAAKLGADRSAARLQRPLAIIALSVVAALVCCAAILGSVWVVDRYFWVDLVFGLGIACMLAVLRGGGWSVLRRSLASRVGLRLGLFSYSIYLIHGPIVGALERHVFGPLDVSALTRFGLFVAIGLPLVLVISYGFHLMFEAPFLQIRDWRALKTLPIARVWPRRNKSLALPSQVAAAQEQT